MTNRYIRIIQLGSATRKERAKETDYWQDYQSCDGLFGERQGVIPCRQINGEWQQLVKQAFGCLANAFARLAADVGDANATLILEKEWECKIPEKIIEAGLMQKARFGHMS